MCDCLNFNYQNLKLSSASFDLNLRFNKLFDIFKVNSINDLDKKISQIIKNIGLSVSIKDFNITTEKDINLILSNINSERLANNPVKIDSEFVKSMLVKKI